MYFPSFRKVHLFLLLIITLSGCAGVKVSSVSSSDYMSLRRGDVLTTGELSAYASAHFEGADSELVISSGHSVQETPEAIIEIRRIMHLHLKESESKTKLNRAHR